MTYRERHQIMTQEVNISTSLMFGLGQAGADWKWTSDTTTTGPDPIVVEADDQDEQVLDQGLAVTEPRSDLSDLDDLYEYYSQVLR